MNNVLPFNASGLKVLTFAVASTMATTTLASNPLYKSAYSFGDSLSDTGNLGLVFSDKTVAVQNVAAALVYPMEPSMKGGNNFAVGGNTGKEIHASVTSPEPYEPDSPNKTPQSTYFMRYGATANKNALYMIIGGGNDAKYVASEDRTPLQVARNIVGSANALGSFGAKYIILLNVPDVGDTPGGPSYLDHPANQLTKASIAMNINIKAQVEASNENILLLNLNRLFQEVQRDPASYGFKDLPPERVNKTCMSKGRLTVPCGGDGEERFYQDDPDKSVFWDGLHPTSTMHKITSDYILQTIRGATEIGSLPRLGFSHNHLLDDSVLSELNQYRWETIEPGTLNFFGSAGGMENQIYNPVDNKNSENRGYVVQAGMHYQLTEMLKLGAAIQTAETKYEPGSSSYKTESLGGSAFANYTRERFFSDLTISYLDLDYHNKRGFNLGAQQRRESSSTSGKLYGFVLDAGYALYDDGFLRAGPIVTGSYHKSTTDGFAESGNSSTAMAFGEQDLDFKSVAGGVFLDVRNAQNRFGLQLDYNKDLDNDDVRDIDLRQKAMSRMAYLPADVTKQDAWRMKFRLGHNLTPDVLLYGSYQFTKADEHQTDYQMIQLGISWSL
ncbi:autotransporter domain-containing protein [Endozoicomonas arenosclerae]|uniref:autotransporter domain-containing protein n=1 Tax=Endozoicomonas arenosclerae TaxID=1633495 RepID=UPI0007841F77|nr:autotransporter domain-containing protein [Endozoicomonas arenosclerae]